MRLYIMLEPDFKTTSSCGAIFAGLKQTLRKKRIRYQTISSTNELENGDGKTFSIIISTNMTFIKNAVSESERLGIHPIILTHHLIYSIPGVYSDVTCDISHSMRSLMAYLKSDGRGRVALYGISEQSFSDMARRDHFLEQSIIKTSDEDIFFHRTGLDDCFNLFVHRLNEYDCVICPNDYVAIHLAKSLKNINYPSNRIKIISYGQLLIALKYHPDIITISTGIKDFGKAAITICEQMQSNPEILHMSLSVKSKILAGTQTPVANQVNIYEEDVCSEEECADVFYKDPHIQNMILIEKLLNSCDKADLHILDMVLEGASYEDISEKSFLSLSAVKYRVRSMVQCCNCDSKKQFTEMVKRYI